MTECLQSGKIKTLTHCVTGGMVFTEKPLKPARTYILRVLLLKLNPLTCDIHCLLHSSCMCVRTYIYRNAPRGLYSTIDEHCLIIRMPFSLRAYQH